MRILLVDDDPEILELVTQFLRLSTHHDVLPTGSAKEALEAVAEAHEPFDCILTDIQMPTVDGIALVQMVRQTPGYAHTPIIMLTAMLDKDHLDRAFVSGASDYLAKPFDFPELQKRLQQAQTLALEKTRASLAVPIVGDFRDMGGEPKEFSIRDAIALPEVASALDYAEFENYLRQLMCRQTGQVTTIAVKIDKIDRVYAAATTDKFRLLLRDAARATTDGILADGGVVSYRGSGIFLCIPEKRLKTRRAVLQKALNRRYAALLQPSGDVAPRLLVGDPVAFGNCSCAQALDALAEAIGNIESHALAANDIFEVHGRVMKQQRFNDEQRRLEKRAFETLLRDPKTPPADDAWTKRLFRRSGRKAGP